MVARNCSGGGAVVVLQDPAEPGAASDLAGGKGKNPWLTRVGVGKWDVADALVRTLGVVVLDILLDEVPLSTK